MKLLYIFIRKEFYHVLRDRKVLLILFGMPVAQVLLFGFALSNEIKNTPIAIIDNAKDYSSQQLISKIDASRYFNVEKNSSSVASLEDAFREGHIKAALIIQPSFSEETARGHAQMQIVADATDVNTADQITLYLNSIINDYKAGMRIDVLPYRITPELVMLYNPQLKGAPNFVPGVMAMVLLLVCVLMTAIAIVKEKESGTMEVLLVSPMKPALVILAKAAPYFLLSVINLIAILLLSITVLDVPVKGSIFLLMAESFLFIIACLTLGIVISNKAKSQEVAMFASIVGMMMPTLLLSGFMFPVENMPLPLRIASGILPSKWYYEIVKAVMVKGVGFFAIWKETAMLLLIALVLFIISVKTFKMRLE